MEKPGTSLAAKFAALPSPPAVWFRDYHTSPVRLSSGTRKHPEQSSYSLYPPFFFALLLVKVMCFIIILHPLHLFSPQPGPELRLPPHPRGSARAPAADGPPARHRGLRLRPQPAPHPPVAGLRHPAACPQHPPPLRALRQRALGRLQRLLTGESGGGRPRDSSPRVIDGAVTRWGWKHKCANLLAAGLSPPPAPLHAHLRGVSSYLCCLLFLGY